MQPYQEEYISNCQAIRELIAFSPTGTAGVEEMFPEVIEHTREAQALSRRNMSLLEENLLPVLDDLFEQDAAVLEDLDAFADALSSGKKAVDLALACQINEALLSRARRAGSREELIRRLYKLGMARYGLYSLLTGVEVPEAQTYSTRMRFCFVEASSYLKYFDDFPEETQAYILRSLANIYLGTFSFWRDKLNTVRHTMQVFHDKGYRESAPGLPWDRYVKTIHQQMTGVLPYTFKEGDLKPDDVEDVMESVHMVYELQMNESREKGQPLDAHKLFPYYALEFGCGLITKDQLITEIESLLDRADVTRYDEINLYETVSLPAFYSQYLLLLPEMIAPRKEYITQLYRRLLDYTASMPPEMVTDQVRYYVRQALSVFVEIEGGIPYRDFALELISRFAPGLYAHGYAVGRMAQAVCTVILENEPDFFDDMPEIRALTDPSEKLEAVRTHACYAGLFHDAGKINFTSLYDHAGRQMLSIEDEILQLHAQAGRDRLALYPSTQLYADAAFGHHRWYDGSGGFPQSYLRRESPNRALVDVIAFANFLENERDDATALPVRSVSFEDKIDEAVRLEGRRFSPLITGWLRTPALLEQLKELYRNGRQEGYTHRFRRSGNAGEK